MLMFSVQRTTRPTIGAFRSMMEPVIGEPWAGNTPIAAAMPTSARTAEAERPPARRCTPWPPSAELGRVGQLAYHQEVLGSHGLLRERHPHQDPGRHLGRGRGLAQGAGRPGLDQC